MTACHRSLDGRFGVNIPLRVLSAMLSECQRRKNTETGGILVGRYDLELRMANVSIATAPPPDSAGGHAWFKRGTTGLRHLLTTLWKAGDYYLGEWHFHPGGIPTPSRQDFEQMLAISCDPQYACPEPVLVIVGGQPRAFTHAAYVLEQGNLASLLPVPHLPHVPQPKRPPTD